jgi:MFS family permease
VLGALKSTLKEELHITNAQYGSLQSSVSVVNTVIPLLGGVFIDIFGTAKGSIVSSTMILVGNALVALSTNLASFPLMLLGRVLYGVGSGCIVLVQETILSHWFKGKGLAVVIGAMISMGKLVSER